MRRTPTRTWERSTKSTWRPGSRGSSPAGCGILRAWCAAALATFGKPSMARRVATRSISFVKMLNYGWPAQTYGMKYGGKPEDWPIIASLKSSGPYELPRFAFVPSIGISQLIEPDSRQFPRWGHHLLVGSLRANSLFLLRLEGDRVAYSEPIPFYGKRLRDLISLVDGRVAVVDRRRRHLSDRQRRPGKRGAASGPACGFG